MRTVPSAHGALFVHDPVPAKVVLPGRGVVVDVHDPIEPPTRVRTERILDDIHHPRAVHLGEGRSTHLVTTLRNGGAVHE